MSDFSRDFLADLGFDIDDPDVEASLEDARAHSQLVETLVSQRGEMTQREVAERMGTTQSRVSNFERIGGDPRLSTVFRYARAVNSRVRFVVSPVREEPPLLTKSIHVSRRRPEVDARMDADWAAFTRKKSA